MTTKPQYSLRWFFCAIAVAGLIVAEGTAFGPQVALAVGMAVSLLSSSALVAGIVYARPFARAFCIGALAIVLATRFLAPANSVSGMSLAMGFYPLTQWWLAIANANGYGVEFCLLWVFAIAGGFVAVFVRWLAVTGNDAGSPRSH